MLICRVLLTQPRIVLMDESTSALDTQNEALLYKALQVSIVHTNASGIEGFSRQFGPEYHRHLQTEKVPFPHFLTFQFLLY